MTTTRKQMKALKMGDAFTVNGIGHIASTDAHESGDSSYDGYIVYDEDSEGWFEGDFPEEVTA